jgi:transposase
MKRYTKSEEKEKEIFVGVDVHLKTWHVTMRTRDVELFSGSIPGRWETLRSLLDRYRDYRMKVVYEAGYFGFWLYDYLTSYGADCIVTPPSLLPQEYGNRVKTDRRDSAKLALLLSRGMLKRVWVPSKQERYHRQVVRRRRQLIKDRTRTQNRIKAELRFHGMEVPEHRGRWSRIFLATLYRVRYNDRFMQESFDRLLTYLGFVNEEIAEQTELLRELAQTELYNDRMELLCTVPGIGVITAMELLLELNDMTRFRRADQLAAYVGLTPSQYSSGEKVRMGRVSKVGKNALRGLLVEAAWTLITKDPQVREKYETLRSRCGAKRAIVAIARILLLRVRRMLLDGQPYIKELAA